MENFRVKELQVSGLNGEVDPPSSELLGTPAATETMSTDWTDEKHSMYLKSMEASFVNQLYNSRDSHGRHTHKGNLSHIKSSKQPQFNSRAASGQFKVLRSGCWQKINFGRGEAEVNRSDCGDLLANPWILHFRSACKPKDVEFPVVQQQVGAICEEVDLSSKKEFSSAAATCLKQFNVSHSNLMHQDMVGGNTEVSDQNFVDEDIKEEKASDSCNSKKIKSLVLQASSNDQVVPFRKPADTEDR